MAQILFINFQEKMDSPVQMFARYISHNLYGINFKKIFEFRSSVACDVVDNLDKYLKVISPL